MTPPPTLAPAAPTAVSVAEPTVIPVAPRVATAAPRLGLWSRAARRLVLDKLRGLARGRLEIVEAWTGERHVFGPDADGVTLCVDSPSFYTGLLGGGSVAVAEAYTRGEWRADDLVGLVRLMLRNRAVLDGLDGGTALLATPLRKLAHWANRNTRAGSRRNIAAHYDLGNAFFATFLDETLTYSSGIFERDDSTMADASRAKLDRLCRKLDLRPGEHLVEIGTGWGSMAVHAAREYGVRVTTTTISRRQHELAVERVRAAGLEGRVEVLLEDYRDLRGRYDKLVSVEMIEAVGHEYLPDYMATLGRLLEPDGLAALQVITIQDQHYERALREVDFIKRHIFPGCFIPSMTAVLDAATASSDLRLFHMEELAPHYARTLRVWRETFLERSPQLAAMGYDATFRRLWEYYLAYCEGGFAERYLGLAQLVFAKPDARREPLAS